MSLLARLKRRSMLAAYRTINRFGYEIRRSDTNHLGDLDSIIRDRVSPTIFDVGCNQGAVAATFLDRWPRASLHAFEPLPDAIELAKRRFVGDPRVTINQVALCDRTGRASFHRTAASDSSSLLQSNGDRLPASYQTLLASAETFEVACDTIDAYCGSRDIAHIDLLKLDVQGAELSVLQGASGALARHAVDIIFSEVYYLPFYASQPLFEDIAAYLHGHGYRFVSIYNPVFGSSTGRLQWSDAIFVSPHVRVPKDEWITSRRIAGHRGGAHG